MSFAKASVQVSGDCAKDASTSTWAEIQLSIEAVNGHLWIRLDPDSAGRCDHYHFRATEARILAAALTEMANELDRDNKKGTK